MKMATIYTVFKHFDEGKDKLMELPALNKASVLVPLFVRSGKLHTLMTLRSEELRTSGGEVCFPGGKQEPGDKDEVDTALREAEEEIGLLPADVHVVCTLQPIITKNKVLVTPVVGFIQDSFRTRPNPAEVSAAFTVPLDLFTLDKDHLGDPRAAQAPTPSLSFHFTDPHTGAKYHIWGLTAMVALLVAAIARKTTPELDVGVRAEELQVMLTRLLEERRSKL
ncbi:peroxisomal coenzyme A diphosphatase NUDT7 isoform X1 [Nerophis ophidion]|uniref:peroxisomal coenzyme A diphosphatase NUDT7 isoform X1 n=1 Tax=Nerophis ophidion TaxID=159077 RepID=UPI002ADF7F09|nr:peroxisomal coenzyme A diphosphatase NUDT7 isoform X1 [Nerophis ophidion]